MNVRKSNMGIKLLALAAIAVVPLPRVGRPEYIPVDRLVQNLGKQLEENPGSARLLYAIARTHYLAFANKCLIVPGIVDAQLGVIPAPDVQAEDYLSSLRLDEAHRRVAHELGVDSVSRGDPKFREYYRRLNAVTRELQEEEWVPEIPTSEEIEHHAAAAERFFTKALEAEPRNALFRLGRASFWEQCLEFELDGILPRRRLITGLEEITRASIADEYYEAFRLSVQNDLDRGIIPDTGLASLVSHEAGAGFLRARGHDDPSDTPDVRVPEVRKSLDALGELKPGEITPILVGTERTETCMELVHGEHSVMFDLDADGVQERWTWVRPETGVLVYDPAGTGHVRSGRDLFGSRTFGLFFRDGYEALEVLDDDDSGYLEGIELRGIAVWKDLDSDGVSGEGEVMSAAAAGIKRIRFDAEIGRDGVLQHQEGIEYWDGRVSPTFDWVTKSAATSSPGEVGR